MYQQIIDLNNIFYGKAISSSRQDQTGVTEQRNKVTSNEVTRNQVTGKNFKGKKLQNLLKTCKID